MPLQDHHKIVSVDDHLIEHPRVWQDRLPETFRDRGPRIVEANGNHVWNYDGTAFPTVGLNAVAGKPPEEWGMDPVRYEDMIPGCYDPSARLKDMDVDGVEAALCFPSFPGFGGGVFQRAQDKDLALLCVRAWNDFYIDEWCATDRSRFVPLSIVPTWDPQLAAAEVRRTAAMGSRTISFPDSPVPLGLPSFHNSHWDPFWHACEETGTVISLHFGSGGFVPGFSFSGTKAIAGEMALPDAPFAVAIATFSTNLMWSTIDLLFSGVLQKHPKLQFSLAEGGIGWIPYILERTDFVWERHRHYQEIDFDTRPSDLFREHFWGCFIDDDFGVENRHKVGIDRIMLEIDYPHSDSNWPNSRKRAAEVLVHVPDDECEKICETNARTMLNFPAPV
ncbi:amidohydrolase family protein [Williamsia sp. DF01-3]|uniref:amidohydrolase family protein n=1 Tax=Williamsia sp. DF01-3 TaxID=2934157 RepID=UPI001FF53511|nr:amidohydrolase family protein [Williamsia sp. DF01-3]MCK0517383.1 amidohydrolase [Williamsia sp. DF01-3]